MITSGDSVGSATGFSGSNFHRDQAINNLLKPNLIVKQGSKLNAVVFSRSAAAIRDAIEADRKSRQIRLPGT